MQVTVYETPDELARSVAASVSSLVSAKRGPFSLGLAGGSTPAATYRALRETPTPWEGVTAWLADERWVAPDSDRSNGRMASETLFEHVGARLERPEWDEAGDPEQSAAGYGRLLRDLESMTGGHDLVLLGLGDDGHTASLFPGSRALDEKEHRYVSNVIPETGETRLTATYPLLRGARRVVFLVTGETKAAALAASLAGETPAGRVDGGDAVVEWHVDRQAASLVS